MNLRKIILYSSIYSEELNLYALPSAERRAKNFHNRVFWVKRWSIMKVLVYSHYETKTYTMNFQVFFWFLIVLLCTVTVEKFHILASDALIILPRFSVFCLAFCLKKRMEVGGQREKRLLYTVLFFGCLFHSFFMNNYTHYRCIICNLAVFCWKN